MTRFQPPNLDKISQCHRIIIDAEREIAQILRNPQPNMEQINFDVFTIRLLKLRIRDNNRKIIELQNHQNGQ